MRDGALALSRRIEVAGSGGELWWLPTADLPRLHAITLCRQEIDRRTATAQVGVR